MLRPGFIAIGAALALASSSAPFQRHGVVDLPNGACRVEAPTLATIDDQIQVTALCACPSESVRITWKYSSGSDFRCPMATETEELVPGFHPTACELLSPTQLVVAGRTKTGNTRIERWTFDVPRLQRDRTSGLIRLVPRGRTEVVVLYDAQTAGKEIVRGLLRKRGVDGRVFVHFQDSRDLYELDASSAPYSMRLVLSKVKEPLLGGEFERSYGADHERLGFLYGFSGRIDCAPDAVVPLFLRDSNRDGVLDSHGTLSGEEWGRDWEDLGGYVEWGGRVLKKPR